MNFIGPAAFRIISFNQISTRDSHKRNWDGFNSSWKSLRGRWESLRGGRNCFIGIWVAKAIGTASETAESTSGAIGRTFKEPRFYRGLLEFYLFLLRPLLESPRCHWNPPRLFHDLYKPVRFYQPLWPLPHPPLMPFQPFLNHAVNTLGLETQPISFQSY